MREWAVTTLPGAEKDISDIYSYIATVLMEPAVAGRLVARLKKAIHSLENMPERYRLYDKEPLRSKGLRMVSVGNYIVFYHTAKDVGKVFIEGVIYGGRDLDEAVSEIMMIDGQ